MYAAGIFMRPIPFDASLFLVSSTLIVQSCTLISQPKINFNHLNPLSSPKSVLPPMSPICAFTHQVSLKSDHRPLRYRNLTFDLDDLDLSESDAYMFHPGVVMDIPTEFHWIWTKDLWHTEIWPLTSMTLTFWKVIRIFSSWGSPACTHQVSSKSDQELPRYRIGIFNQLVISVPVFATRCLGRTGLPRHLVAKTGTENRVAYVNE